MITIFISYSHDSESHMTWVKKLVEDLRQNSEITVLYDQDVPKGASFTRFMEIGMQAADKVLVIGTPKYKEKTLKSSGVAFEEAIISSDLMNDIDSTKYYPILREGSFASSFPSPLIGRKGDDFTDNEQYEKNLQELIRSLTDTKELPEILKSAGIQPMEMQNPIAKVYFSIQVLFETMFGQPTGKVEGIAFGVEVTNLSKELRYYTRPYFKCSVKYDGFDTFELTESLSAEPTYPVVLNYGQPFSICCRLRPKIIDILSGMLSIDSNATITACAKTTIGEEVTSNSIRISELVKDFKYIK